ncbi:MAG: hypothetical protein AAFO83_00265 [Cyanobacteria bacterium J06607_13]
MATTQDLSMQSQTIADLAVKIRNALTKKTTLTYFLQNPAIAEGLIASTGALKSQRIILYGLKEALIGRVAKLQQEGTVVDATNVDVLPTQADLTGQRANNWLSAGDVIGGWIGYLADRPRVVDEATLTGYLWHFYGDDDNVQGPGLGVKALDKWLSSYGWVKLNGTNSAEIFAEQAAEIENLKQQLQYFQTKQFLKG